MPDAVGLLAAALRVTSGYTAGYTAVNAVVGTEVFPAAVRAVGVSFPYAATVAVFGGTAEYLALWARRAGHEAWYAWYVTALVAAPLLVDATMPEMRDAGALTDPPAES